MGKKKKQTFTVSRLPNLTAFVVTVLITMIIQCCLLVSYTSNNPEPEVAALYGVFIFIGGILVVFTNSMLSGLLAAYVFAEFEAVED